ncbi:RRP40 [Vairimorpha necatrix]|uniref:RRP40 n=1 Tax=Vairimorpha necatrix TaxID=6039 RepID=A0AAX4JEG2_9MICR
MRFTKLHVVFPGDEITQKGSFSLGLYKKDNILKSYVFGTLCKIQDHLFVLSKTNRYFPYIDDIVLGRVIYTSSEYYKVDLDTYLGILPVLSFTNASKRNRPDIKKDDWVLCKIVDTGLEPILSCVGENFGKVEGKIFKITVWKSQMIYVGDFLQKIGQKYNFKCSVGINGFISIEGDSKVIKEVYNQINKM